MAAEEAGHGHEDRLSALGQVGEPAPEVLAAARERLWAAVAAEMLGTDAGGPADERGAGAAAHERGGERGREGDGGRQLGGEHERGRGGEGTAGRGGGG